MYAGDLRAAVELLEESVVGFRAIGEAHGEFDSLILLAATTFLLEDTRAEGYGQHALALAETHGALSSKAYALWSVGIVAWGAGRIAAAVRSLREALRLWQPLNDWTGISSSVQVLSWCASTVSQDAHAARLLGASRAVMGSSGARLDEANAYIEFDQRAQGAVREVLGDSRFEQAFAEGASYSIDQAVALALGGGRQGEAGDRPVLAKAEGVLTRREREIAQPFGEGLSNKEIAARLVISQRTAEAHVEHILMKLGFTSRAQVASWLAEQQAR